MESTRIMIHVDKIKDKIGIEKCKVHFSVVLEDDSQLGGLDCSSRSTTPHRHGLGRDTGSRR